MADPNDAYHQDTGWINSSLLELGKVCEASSMPMRDDDGLGDEITKYGGEE
jgi:hypothetical protein